ncbi:MAG: Response regulator protein VraR [Syntrophorhabdus sp. PtaU1.Bin153]|nr:MAG: Response regulator protein VraR [Syntrophorhabdus sp. PtaU1.Bin153]
MNPPFGISLDLLTEVFEIAPDIAVNLLNKDYTVLWANRVMSMAVEQPLHEMIGKKCYAVWRRRGHPCPVCLLKIVSETRKPCVMERWLDLPGKERRYAEVRAYPVFDKQGLVKHVFEIIIPLTDKKKDEDRRNKYVESLEKTIAELNAVGIAGQRRVIGDREDTALTTRELEVLRLIGRGFSNKEIAGLLHISPDTVKTHIKNIFSKLDVPDRTQAAIWAVSHGLG